MRVALVLALVLGLVTSNRAAAVTPIPSAHGTAVIDGIKSAGEWDAATPRAVFSSGTLAGSLLYVMDDDINIYLGLFVPDATFMPSDAMWTRFDSKNDGVTMAGDDEVNGRQNDFFDSHFDGVSWAIQDLHYNGSAQATAVPGGNFFEIAHAINTGDPDDMYVNAGQTISLCAFYANDGTIFGSDDYPDGCLGSGLSQTTYVDYTISSTPADVSPQALLAAAHLRVAPNPVRRGAELAVYYGVNAAAGPPEIGLYSVAGRKLADLGPLSSEDGEHVLHWENSGTLSPGVYFVRARYEGIGIRSRTLIVH
ncbi:MAG TPA: hypothetical protein VGR66_07335 [Candidatus Eisenbacteria bacterium]|jgi:hypothetical protein|nr:hypothetical protein [Candidatus Eisenbacteria bacterium]